ncbi:hypothetical protein LIA77_07453 [Sarocladium implicatum]|nr:hypothetical protein LIA77_07453 [Sarocladium implicatum]
MSEPTKEGDRGMTPAYGFNANSNHQSGGRHCGRMPLLDLGRSCSGRAVPWTPFVGTLRW